MMIRNFFKTIKATWLCLRFPFLYPRNRFTGKHYNNWEIIEFHRKYYQFLSQSFFFDIKRASEFPEGGEKKNYKTLGVKGHEHNFILNSGGNTVFIRTSNPKISWSKPKSEILVSGEVLGAFFHEGRETILVSDDAVVSENFCRFVNVDLGENLLRRIIGFLDWVNDYPLQWLHCLTDYTELDALDKGWRKKFGMDLCKDLKKQLKKEGRLRSFRITQLKEKYGELRLYHNGSTEIDQIIDKYAEISMKTCIICGKPATKMTSGYVLPYCDDCFPEGYKFTKIGEEPEYA